MSQASSLDEWNGEWSSAGGLVSPQDVAGGLVPSQYTSDESGVQLLEQLARRDDIFKTILPTTFKAADLYHAPASHPSGPGILVGVKDISTPARQEGKNTFGAKVFKEKFDGDAPHPFHWHLTNESKAFFLISGWLGTADNGQNWLAKEMEPEIRVAELGAAEILACNSIVFNARQMFQKEFGWNLPPVAAGGAYWYRVRVPDPNLASEMAVYVLKTFGRVGGWR
jgi:hypothetical protein